MLNDWGGLNNWSPPSGGGLGLNKWGGLNKWSGTQEPAISSSVNVTWPMFEVSAVQASETPAISSSVNVTWPMFEVSAVQASETPAISSSVNVTWSMFEVSAVVGKFDYYTDPRARIDIISASRRIDL